MGRRVQAVVRWPLTLYDSYSARTDRFDLLEVIDVVPGIVHRDIENGFGAAFGVHAEHVPFLRTQRTK